MLQQMGGAQNLMNMMKQMSELEAKETQMRKAAQHWKAQFTKLKEGGDKAAGGAANGAEMVIIEGANHFFTGKEKELEQSIRAYIDAAPQLLPPEEDEIEEDEVEEEDVEMDFDDILDAMDAE